MSGLFLPGRVSSTSGQNHRQSGGGGGAGKRGGGEKFLEESTGTKCNVL